MKVLIRQNATTKTGYELVSIDELGNEIVKPIENTSLEKKTGIHWLVLPENDANRKLINPAKLEKAGGTIELTYKESIKTGPRATSAPTKKLIEYLTDDELKIYDDLMTKAKARRDADVLLTKRDNAIEKYKAEMEKLQAKINELKNNK